VRLQRRRSLEAQQRQQERWVSDVAHELKTPLTALLLVGDSLAAQVNSRNAVLVERLQRELRRLQQLVGDILELSRLENTLPGQGQSRSNVALAALVEQVWSGLRPLAEERSIQLKLTGDAEARVEADSARLHRALLNLLDNAIRFSPDRGTVEVEISTSRGWCLVAVRDHGEGLSPQDQTHLFERFYRGDPARMRSRRSGSGLGLAIVQQIAITMGGRVQATNHPQGGALLELVLPMGS
jgi:two-component system phosphate regulon sensor histidine kinase PhoR